MCQWSLDMATWYDSGSGPEGDARTFSVNLETDLGDTEEISASIPKGSEPGFFMRLRLE